MWNALEIELNKLAVELRPYLEERLKQLAESEFAKSAWTLPLPRICVMQAKRSKRIKGWYSSHRWQQGPASLDEIVLTPDTVSHGVYHAAQTLVHEFAHLANHSVGLPDTSNGGRYHNRQFQQTASTCGLIVERDDNFGACKTKLGGELKKFLQGLIETQKVRVHPFKYRRLEDPSSGRSLVKLVCACDRQFIYVTAKRASTIEVFCGECEQQFRRIDEWNE